MILMLVKGEGSLGRELDEALRPYGISVVHYRNPIKAMDNILETGPRIILYHLQDFPRHWKILLKFLREDTEREQTIFLLFGEQRPSLEEANKALFLGVNGILNYSGVPAELGRSIREIFLRYGSLDLPTGTVTVQKNDDSPLGFVFRHPRKKHLITGVLTSLGAKTATFRPDYRHETADLESGDWIDQGSLRLGENLLTINGRIVRNSGQLHLDIEPATEADKTLLSSQIVSL